MVGRTSSKIKALLKSHLCAPLRLTCPGLGRKRWMVLLHSYISLHLLHADSKWNDKEFNEKMDTQNDVPPPKQQPIIYICGGTSSAM
ncbi:uncharacterized protein LOC134295474 isoform X2 [Anolis carolinensis]|uniref:uncharacterized protein LOC134295474 isoform X2 n=1 Tax=Anolis carolinensis TaxID=28377 RepID=UPI002F2B89BD